MKDNEISELVNEIVKISRLHHDKGCFRELISRTVNNAIKGVKSDVITAIEIKQEDKC